MPEYHGSPDGSGTPVLRLVQEDAAPALTVRHEGASGNAVEVRGANGVLLWNVDAQGNHSGDLRVGNVTNWDPGPHTGSPAGNVFPVKFLHQIGTPGTPVPQTNQAFVGWATYKERTLDDSAEAASYGVILTDAYGGFASAQTLPVVAFEADALTQGAVVVSNKVVAQVGGVKIQNTSHADSVMHFYAAQTVVDAGATVTNRYGFYDEGVTGTRPTNVWSVYAREAIQAEKALYVGVAGAQTSNLGMAMVTGPNVTGGAADIPSLVVRPGPGQTAATLRVDTNGGLTRIAMFGATGNIQLGNGASGGSGVGMLSMVTTTAPSGTPPAAGAYLYVDPADNKLKAKTSGGTITILTPTA